MAHGARQIEEADPLGKACDRDVAKVVGVQVLDHRTIAALAPVRIDLLAGDVKAQRLGLWGSPNRETAVAMPLLGPKAGHASPQRASCHQ